MSKILRKRSRPTQRRSYLFTSSDGSKPRSPDELLPRYVSEISRLSRENGVHLNQSRLDGRRARRNRVNYSRLNNITIPPYPICGKGGISFIHLIFDSSYLFKRDRLECWKSAHNLGVVTHGIVPICSVREIMA